MTNEFTPELDDQVLEAIKRKIAEQQAQQVSAAQGAASARGLTGSTYEATHVGLANQGAINAQTDAMVNLALQRATQQREERLTQEQRAYESGETQKSRDFQDKQSRLSEQYNSLENEKQRAYASGETDKARQFEEQQAEINRQFQAGQAEIGRQFDSSQADQASRDSLINSGITGGLGLVGNIIGRGGKDGTTSPGILSGITGKIGGLFGGGTSTAPTGALGSKLSLFGSGPGSTLTGTTTPAGGGLGLGGAAGIGAGLFGGGVAGQNLAKLTGNNTNEAKFGSAIGAGAGTAVGSLFGPVGSAVGGTLGGAAAGLTTKLYQGIGKATGLNKPVNNVVSSVKKLFCFDGDTLISDVDGDLIPISEISLGDELLDGGIVESVRISGTADKTRFNYKNIIVTGSHAVKEEDTWIRVEDSLESVPIPGPGIVYSLVTSTHRIFINGIEFADEHETNDYETLSINESLKMLNLMVA